MISDQYFSGHVTHENPNSSKSKIGQWYSVAFFFQKMIFVETWYKPHNKELLAIIEVFKIWHHYFEGGKYKVFVFTNHNNLCRFMDTKSLSFHQVCWAQKLSQFYFQIDYRQQKANTAADALFYFLQRSQAKEKTVRDENSQILHCLQTSLTKAIIAGLSLSSLALPTDFSMLYQVLICKTHILLPLY